MLPGAERRGESSCGCDRRETATGATSDGNRDLVAVSVVGCYRPESARGEPNGWSTPLDRAAAERGRTALLLEGFLKPEWSEAAYRNAGQAMGGAGSRSREGPGRLCRRIPAPLRPAPGPLPQRRAADGPAPGLGPGGREDGPSDRLHALSRRLDRRPELRRAGKHPARLEGGAVRADDRRRQAAAASRRSCSIRRAAPITPARSRPLC